MDTGGGGMSAKPPEYVCVQGATPTQCAPAPLKKGKLVSRRVTRPGLYCDRAVTTQLDMGLHLALLLDRHVTVTVTMSLA